MKEEIFILLNSVKQHKIKFTDVIAFIENYYSCSPAAFKNGEVYNEASQNQGSAKVFSFARLHGLSEEDTLHLFAEHYQSVRDTPEGDDHQNIRQFMANGWAGVKFEGEVLSAK